MKTFARTRASLRALTPLLLGALAGCTVPVAAVTDDTSTAQGALADGTVYEASSGVFGGLADDGTETVPPLDASFQAPRPNGRVLKLEVRTPVSYVLPLRQPSIVEVCLTDEGPGEVMTRCELPTLDLHLDQDSSDCSQQQSHGNVCLVQVSGEITIGAGSLFNGTVRFQHGEHWDSRFVLDDGNSNGF
jgi:hypothetical protein